MARHLRILLRADAAGGIGIGHVKRCLSLGQALSDCGAEVVLLTQLRDVDTGSIARQAGIDCIPLSKSAADDGWETDAHETAGVASQREIDWVVVDHYGLDARWHRQVAAAGSRIAVIDDLADRPLEAAVVVDHNAADHSAKYAAVLASATPLLGGPRYALLSRAYVDAPRWHDRGGVRSIGIFMGGTDPAAMSELALEACRGPADFTGQIEIATTRGNARLPILIELCKKDPRTSLVIDAENLAAFFARHDMQIGAGGGATWERCCVGAPTLLLRCAPNQDAVIPALLHRGVVRALSPGLDQEPAAVGAAVRELVNDDHLRRTLSLRSRDTVDGLGARRVALFLAAQTLHVRPARLEDAQLLHRWRNEISTRAMSSDPREISLESHMAWFARALEDASRSLLIGMVGEVPVGSIRFDRLPSGELEVSLYLDPTLHGLRLGTQLLEQGEAHMKSIQGTEPAFVATVIDSNLGSRRLFSSAGYRNTGDRWRKAATSLKKAPQ